NLLPRTRLVYCRLPCRRLLSICVDTHGPFACHVSQRVSNTPPISRDSHEVHSSLSYFRFFSYLPAFFGVAEIDFMLHALQILLQSTLESFPKWSAVPCPI